MKTLEQRIEEIEELNRNRTQGEWYKDVSRSISSTTNGVRSKITNQEWFEDNSKSVKHSDIDFMVKAPEMAKIIQELQQENKQLKEQL